MNPQMETFGTTLKKLRRERRISQQTLADTLHLQRTTVTNYECGRSYPNLDVFVNIAKFFSVSSDALLGLIQNSVDATSLIQHEPDTSNPSPTQLPLPATRATDLLQQMPGRVMRIAQLERRLEVLYEIADDLSNEIQELRAEGPDTPE